MDYRNLSDADLSDFSKNVEDQLIAHAVTGIDNTLADDLAAPLTPLNVSYPASIELAVENTAVKQSVVADKQSIRDDLLVRLATVRNYLIAAAAPRKSFERCGFTYPSPASIVTANDPTELAATGTSNGVNRITFIGNNRRGRVIYEVWRRQGDDGPWGIIAAIRRQAYSDTPVTPGQYYEYKVRAVAATNTSNFSNSAVVYGAI